MKISSKINLLLCLFLLTSVTGAGKERVLYMDTYIEKYGTPDNICPAVWKALEVCRKEGIHTLVFSKGVYRFRPDGLKAKHTFVSNHGEAHRRFAFDLSGLHNLKIDGQGSEFLFKGFVCPFLIDHARKINICNLSIDYERTFHSEGKILEGTPDYFDVSFGKEYPYRISDGHLVFLDDENTEYRWSYLLEYDPVKQEPAYKVDDYAVDQSCPVKDLGNGRVRIERAGIKATPGNTMVFGPAHRDIPAITVSDSRDITIESVTLYHCGGMGVVAQRSKNILLDKVIIKPTPGKDRLVSLTADATHFANCSGHVRLYNCSFEGQRDDATNIHGVYYRIKRIHSPHSIEVELVHGGQFGFDYLKPGMKIEFVQPGSLHSYESGKIMSVKKLSKQCYMVELQKPVSSNVKEQDAIAGDSEYPTVHIKRCYFAKNRARGLLLGSRGKTIIEDNTFHVPGAAILMEGDARFWFEQAGVRHLTIRRNVFDNCNFGVWGGACIETGPGIEESLRDSSRYNRHILIENNIFRIFSAPVLRVFSVSHLTFKNNTIIPTRAYHPQENLKERLFDIRHSDHIHISDPHAD